MTLELHRAPLCLITAELHLLQGLLCPLPGRCAGGSLNAGGVANLPISSIAATPIYLVAIWQPQDFVAAS